MDRTRGRNEPAMTGTGGSDSPLDLGFGSLPPETLKALAASSIARRFPKNAVLINEGEHGDSLFIVLSGRLKVYASNEAGKEIVIDFHGPGECVGEMSIDGSPRSASVITTEALVVAGVPSAPHSVGGTPSYGGSSTTASSSFQKRPSYEIGSCVSRNARTRCAVSTRRESRRRWS